MMFLQARSLTVQYFDQKHLQGTKINHIYTSSPMSQLTQAILLKHDAKFDDPTKSIK